jgi:hypothetical protein
MRWLPTHILIPAQVAAAIVGLVALTMTPPPAGAMLLVPLAPADANAGARVALAAGAQLLGGGPFPGSLVVIGDRARIASQIRAWDFLLMAAPPAGCGATAPEKSTP